MNFEHILLAALETRQKTGGHSIAQANSLFRACCGKPDGIDGVVVDVLGKLVWVRVFKTYDEETLQYLLHAATSVFKNHDVFLSARRPDNQQSPYEWILPGSSSFESAPLNQEKFAELTYHARERDLIFEIRNRPLDDFGIYVDARVARTWVFENSSGCSVLNLFSYTCAFGVAAARGGATEVTNVDVSHDYLTWGKQNAALNGVDFKVVPEDCLKYLGRLANRIQQGKKDCPDIVVLDPPAFLAGRGKNRLARNVWPDLIKGVATVTSRKGSILISCNDAYQNRSGQFAQNVSDMFGLCKMTVDLQELTQSPDVTMPLSVDSHYLPPTFWVARFK